MIKYKIPVLLGVLLNLFLVHRVSAFQVQTSFVPPAATAAGLVASYCLYYQATNAVDPGNWHYLSQCPVGYTNIYTDTTAIMANPAWLSMTTIGKNGQETVHSARLLFDTNRTPMILMKLAINALSSRKVISIGPVVTSAEIPLQISVAVPPNLHAIRALNDGSIRLDGVGLNKVVYTVLASININTPTPVWVPIGMTTTSGTNLQFIDTEAMHYSQRFYRFSNP